MSPGTFRAACSSRRDGSILGTRNVLGHEGNRFAIRLLSRGVSSTVTVGRNLLYASMGLALIPSKKQRVNQLWDALRLSLMGFAALFGPSCARHLEFPPMGEPLPYTVKLDVAPSIKRLVLQYANSCGQPVEIPLGEYLDEALIEGAYRTFKTVVYEGDSGKAGPPDHVLRVDLVNWGFELNKDALYDRAPANLRVTAMARVYDRAGILLRETEIDVIKRERLRLERMAKNCDYVIDPFIQDAVVEFASKASLDARLAFGAQQPPSPGAQKPEAASAQAAGALPPSPSATILQPPQAAVPSGPSSLRFKALLLDENSNLILEGGEHVRVRVDVVNTGVRPIQNASAILTGTPSIIGQFPTTTLAIPPLQPGETKSTEFIATLSPVVQQQRGEIHVVVIESGGATAPSQTLSLAIQPTAVRTDDVDQVPAPVSSFQRPNTFLISIGVGSYRNPKLPPRKYAATDAEMVVNYIRSLGGVPPSNVRLLQDSKARRLDIDEALWEWLPLRSAKDMVVIVYFSGQAMVAANGDILLVPFEGSPTATMLLYPLKDLESALSQLQAKQIIFVFDGMVSKFQADLPAKPVVPRWELNGGNTIRLIGGEGFTKGLEDDTHRHSLFTYYLLRGLRGEADTNRDGAVTLGELAGYARQKVAWAAKSQFNVEQRPQVLPILKPGDKAAALVLSTLASLTGAETP